MAALGIAVLSIVALAGVSVAVYSAWLFHDMPNAADLANSPIRVPSQA